MAIDPTPISGAAGLVKSHTVTQDSETTVMRTGADMQDTAGFVARQSHGCKGQNGTLKSIFRMRGKSQTSSLQHPNSRDCGEFNTRDGELNG